MITLGQIIFHPLIAGFILAAVLGGNYEYVSSQIIVTSSALVEDLYKTLLRKNARDREYVFLGRLAVCLYRLLRLSLAFNPDSTILELVAYAWAGFGGAFRSGYLVKFILEKMTNWGALLVWSAEL